MFNKPIKLPSVEWEMLCSRGKKKHKKPEEYIQYLIREDYNNGK